MPIIRKKRGTEAEISQEPDSLVQDQVDGKANQPIDNKLPVKDKAVADNKPPVENKTAADNSWPLKTR